uniref:Uncharacterized protein n=1 Tax=Brassica oleracea var. oleracea TaxID=109376 RepID=A0A0D3BIT4_BRAOL
MNFRGNSEDHQFVGKVFGIYRGRNSLGYFDGLSDGPILGNSDEMFLGIFIGNFRGTEPSKNSEEGVPQYIPTTYSEEIPPVEPPSRSPTKICDHPCPSTEPAEIARGKREFGGNREGEESFGGEEERNGEEDLTKGKGVVDEEGEDEAAQAIPDDSQPHQLLPSDSSQYKLQELPPNATSRQQQHWRDQSIKTNNDMLHKIWAAISRIRPCRCQKDDVVHRDNSPSSSGSGSSGTHRVRKRSKRPNDAEHLEQETRSRSYHRLFYFLFYSNVLWSYFLLILN